MKYEEVKEEMAVKQYEFGELNQIDIKVCADATCEECGHKGLKYAGFKKGNSYRAWAVCPECDEVFEF